MEIRINGDTMAFDTKAVTVGDALGELDGKLESAGQAIVSLSLDGRAVTPEDIAGLNDIKITDARLLELRSESVLASKSKAVVAFLGILDSAGRLAKEGPGSEPPREGATWPEVAAAAKRFLEALGGLFSAEEVSFIEYFQAILPGNARGPTDPAPLVEMIERLELVFGERRDELLDPAGAMAAAERLFSQRKADILDVPVRLQTGKDADAMHTLSFLIELINKTVRIVPSLAATGLDLSRLEVGTLGLNDFYAGFNASLRELMEAFERKDIILIGDLAEYELVPRLEAFFESFHALPDAGNP